MKQIALTTKVNDNWVPLQSGCWTSCPCASLIPLGQKCEAIISYQRDGIVVCPFARYGYQVVERNNL